MFGEYILLERVLTVEIVVLALATSAYIAHGIWLALSRARDARLLAAGRHVLMLSLVAPDGPLADLQALRALSERARLALIAELAPSLSGALNSRLREVADAIGLTATAEARCGSRFWWRRLQGVRMLTLVGGGEHVVTPLLADADLNVRAEAAAWAADHPNPDTLAGLVNLLTSDRAARFAVQDALLRMGDRAAPSVAAYLAVHHGEAAVPALRVAVGLQGPLFLPAAQRLTGDAWPETRAGAAELLGAVGGEAAVDTLLELTADPIPTVRGAAARALAAGHHWRAAGRLKELLADADFGARRDAALALRALGPTGDLLLRLASAEDLPSSEIARMALAGPAPA